MFRKLIGDRGFYRQVLRITMPILIQNFITNFVSMLDNVMVGRVGGSAMSGVSVSNQLMFVFNLCIFGAVSGAGIFGAQFYGRGDNKGLRHTFRFKILSALALSAIGIGIFIALGQPMIRSYLKGEGDPAAVIAAFGYAKEYLHIMLIGLIPYAIVQCYSGTLRETGETVFPMVAGIVAVLTNLVLNYFLIFDHFGYGGLGVAGAAIATVISRFVELLVVVIWVEKHKEKHPFFKGAFHSFRVPLTLVKQILMKGLPLVANETLWAAGLAMMNQCYSERGLDVVEANNICQTFFNVFSVAFIAVGSAIGILLGQLLGAGKREEARASSMKLIAFSVFVSGMVALLFAISSEFIPLFYKTTDDVRLLATRLMQICALVMPLDAFANASYFTLRSGGKTITTILFDSVFSWRLAVPVAFVLSRYTAMPILPMFAICQFLNVIKCVIGFLLVKRGAWIVNIVDCHAEEKVA